MRSDGAEGFGIESRRRGCPRQARALTTASAVARIQTNLSPPSRHLAAPSIMASNTAEASTAWICSVVVPQLRKPCRRPAGTISDWPAVTIARSLADPHLGLAFAHGQHLFDRMRMGRRAGAGRDPLLEDAELRRAVGGRNHHAGLDARPPLFQAVSLGSLTFTATHPFVRLTLAGQQSRRFVPAPGKQHEATLTTDPAMALLPAKSRSRHRRRARHRACDGETISRRGLAGGAARHRGRIAARRGRRPRRPRQHAGAALRRLRCRRRWRPRWRR